MAYPLKRFSDQLEGASTNKVGIQDVSASPLKLDEKGAEEDEDDARPMTSFMPQVMKSKLWHELTSVRTWRNHVIWRAGVIEGVGSGSLNFVSGLVVATLSNWPRAAVPAGNFIYITILVSCLISATTPATGGHINPLITMATAFSGLCHPVRAIIYLFCQLVGGAIGGALLRVALGKKLAYHIHNGGCWIDPGGEVDVWQAASIEFTCSFILIFLAFGVGLDPRQAKVFGAKYGPILVGLIVGLMVSVTSIVHEGYTGAGMFPGRCFGLAAGIGEFQKSHWVWWIPDILAAALHGLLYVKIPPYIKPSASPIVVEMGRV